MPAQTHVLDVRRELNEAPTTPFHWRLVALVFVATLFDGYDTFIPAYTIHYVVKPWGLEPSQAGLLVSSGLVGFLVGSLVHGVIADRLGRRPTLIGGLLITGIAVAVAAALAAVSSALTRGATALPEGVSSLQQPRVSVGDESPVAPG